jgi:hypothetical protein
MASGIGPISALVGGSGSGGAEPPDQTVSGFLLKTFEIFSDPENHDMCSWGPKGDTIVVKKVIT